MRLQELLPKTGNISLLKLFICVIALPGIIVAVTVCFMQRENHDHKVTHEVLFEIEIGGKREGRMVVGLFGETVPLTVHNFYTLATSGYKGYRYQGTIFHKAIKKFMIQGGDVLNANGTGSISIYGETFPDESFAVHHSSAGFVSMANAGKDSNGCQFFITTLAANWLDGKHVAFGKVVEGQGILHKIEYMATDWDDQPLVEAKIAKSSARKVSTPYWVNDDPYNLRDWLKTVSIPLSVSFGIILIFNHFIGKLDSFIDADEELYSEGRNAEEEEEKAGMKEDAPDHPSIRKRK